MQRLSVAVAKAQFSALLARVEGGQEVVITRRGVLIARIVPEAGKPIHTGADAGTVLSELRRDARY
jgi:prevent-host-death family protein